MSDYDQLKARQHARTAIELDVEFIIRPDHREQVQFSGRSTVSQPHIVRGITADISTGGMGVVCRQFLPRMCEGTVRVFDPEKHQAGNSVESKPEEVAFEVQVKVHRVTMISHAPSYCHGMAFINPDPDIEQRINKLRQDAEQWYQPPEQVQADQPVANSDENTDQTDPIIERFDLWSDHGQTSGEQDNNTGGGKPDE